MPARIPSFLLRRGATSPTGPGTSAQETAPAKPASIFRAKPPALIERADDAPVNAPAPASAIFRKPPPKLLEKLAEPATPRPERPLRTRAKPQARDVAEAAPSRAPLPDAGEGFRIVALTRLAHGGGWRTEAMRSYGAPVLLWFTRGQGRITVAGVTRGFGPHNAIWMPANTMHGFEPTGQVFGHAVFFPRGTELPLPEEPHHLRFRDSAEQNELNLLIDGLQRELDRALPIADRAVGHHAGLLSVWLERQVLSHAEGAAPAKAAHRLSSAYAELVEREYRSGRTVADLAAELGVTPTHLTRSCNAACGRSAHDILADRIFFEARRLLRDSGKPVKDIAEELGFTSAAYFTRAFQKATGETPTAFRAHS